MDNQQFRDNWVKEQLASLAPGLKLLDAGAGEQRYKQYCQHLQYVSQDFAQYDGQGDKVALQTGSWNKEPYDLVSDITAIPVKNSSFDVVLCTEVLEHIPYPDQALREFARILKPGGKLILTAPFASLTHFAPYFYYSGFSKYFYSKILPEAGFALKTITPVGNYFDYLEQELKRIPTILATYGKLKRWTLRNLLVRLATGLFLLFLGLFSRKISSTEELLTLDNLVLAIKK